MHAAHTTTADEDATFDDVSSVLDRPLLLTKFRDPLATSKSEHTTTLRQLAPLIVARSAPVKGRLPLLKLGRFGDAATAKGSLRSDANLRAIEGVEGDHDAGTVSMEDAAGLLRAAGVAALLYTTPSHTPSAPRWRVLCALSAPMHPREREALCARLNGVLRGALAGESFTPSQTWYYGGVAGSPAAVELVAGEALDRLPAGVMLGRDGTPYAPRGQAAPPVQAGDDGELKAEPDRPRIARALDALPPSVCDDYQSWLSVGMALHHEFSGADAGRELWDGWSQASLKYDAATLQAKWDGFGRADGRPRTIATLHKLARDHAPAALPQPGRLAFLSPGQCAAAPSRGYVLKGMLAPRDVGCIFGAPGGGKSLLAPHVGYMVAQGKPAFGMRTRAGGVLYVAAEDAHGMRGRVTALKAEHGDAPAFALVEGVSDLLAPDSPDLAALKAAVAERRPALIFLDTLAMSFPGLEENTAEGMGRVVKAARELTEHGAAVVLIHHDTKAGDSTPRGHSLLNGALDMALHLYPRGLDGVIPAVLTKNRNGGCDRTIAFRIAARELGRDEDGDAITAALVAEAAPPPAKGGELTGAERAALAVLREMLQLHPTVREEDWRRECLDRREVSASELPNSRRAAVRRAMAGLLRKGKISVADGCVSIPVPDEDWPS